MQVFITGVSSGLGHGFAAQYLNRGDIVHGVSRRRPESLATTDNFRHTQLDLADFDRIPGVLEELLDGLEALDLAILNAGILGEFGDIEKMGLDRMRHVMDVNCWSNKVLLDHVYARGLPVRQVVAISSGAAVSGNRGWNAYAISKAALNMLISLYAAERPETHFCAVAPGLIDTAMQTYLCGLPADERYPTLERLRRQRNTLDMPMPQEAAARLIPVIESLPQRVESGAFVDARQLDQRQ